MGEGESWLMGVGEAVKCLAVDRQTETDSIQTRGGEGERKRCQLWLVAVSDVIGRTLKERVYG